MGKVLTRVTQRIVELTAQQGVIQARADAAKAAVQVQINTLVEIEAAMTADPALEALYVKATALKLTVE